jgi:hypothetical protein
MQIPNADGHVLVEDIAFSFSSLPLSQLLLKHDSISADFGFYTIL